jgi:predicted nucleic acid-binding protein
MPDAPRGMVVVNTTPIIALSIVGRLDLLQSLYGEVWIPPAVYGEVMAGAGRPGTQDLERALHSRRLPVRSHRGRLAQ